MVSPKITTLSEFLADSGAQYRIFDMARRVIEINHDDFSQIEKNQQPYPYPLQKTAHFGVLFWNPDFVDQHIVWFLKFPLDEQGLLIQAARDEFLAMLVDRIGKSMMTANDGNKVESVLRDSPYTFKPREDKMAAFNAQASYNLAINPSRYYHAALAYFTGKISNESWQSLAMQGVADVAIRSSDKQSQQAIAQQLAALPAAPFLSLCTFLEQSEPMAILVDSFAAKLTDLLGAEIVDTTLVAACLRAISNSPATGLVDKMVVQVLNHPIGLDIEILATLSGRLWRIIHQADLCQLFVERLAQNSAGYAGFSQVLADALYLPRCRQPIMTALRSPNRSQALSLRAGEMLGQAFA